MRVNDFRLCFAKGHVVARLLSIHYGYQGLIAVTKACNSNGGQLYPSDDGTLDWCIALFGCRVGLLTKISKMRLIGPVAPGIHVWHHISAQAYYISLLGQADTYHISAEQKKAYSYPLCTLVLSTRAQAMAITIITISALSS